MMIEFTTVVANIKSRIMNGNITFYAALTLYKGERLHTAFADIGVILITNAFSAEGAFVRKE